MFYQSFTVSGRLSFPLDMLRYDCCFPSGPEDAGRIQESMEHPLPAERLVIKLSRRIEAKGLMPTSGRWSSFGWVVDERSIKTTK